MKSCSQAEPGMHAPYHGSLLESTLSQYLHAIRDFSNPLLRMSLLETAEMHAESCHMPAMSGPESNTTYDDTR